jgi:hypothetical protein
MIPELERFTPHPELKRFLLTYEKSYKIPPNYGHALSWMDSKGQPCQSILTKIHFTGNGKRKARLVESNFLFSKSASHYYASITASAPSIQVGSTIYEIAGYGPERDALEDYLGPINIEAQRRLTKVEKDLNGNLIGKIGEWTYRFNSNTEARQAAIRTFRERFASGWALLEEFTHEHPIDET